MKKILALLTAFLIFFAGCTAKNEQNTPKAQIPEPKTEEPAQPPQEPEKNNAMKVTFFKLGNADSILLEIGDQTMLIDTGEKGDGSKVFAVLQDRQITKLDYLIITHFDKDHVGGAPRLLAGISIDHILQPNSKKDSEEYRSYVETMAEQGLTPKSLVQPEQFMLGSASVRVIPAASVYPDENNNSMMVELTYGEKSFLFAGDAERERLSEYLKTQNKAFDVLKVPHHGRINDGSRAFFQIVKPSIAVITCGKDTQNTCAVCKLLESMNTEVYMTYDGMITMLCDGKEILVKQNE